ncbi:WXG100 family type VII secretion target [Oscillochloris sp. ZM17-4]|uniref:WXG100 family type VII secretion target n=1 Tax=Oscillochloris sp. ZM17-4 TaxID=2866714 RepID=UPI001C738DCF|nr:WXG100 family type VII secretion target [Oscillochloris sp. ZM17-4]MBX0329901.1 WXG100 family type VII secretion target [Oscillochloris sp. ZM17-4]
MTDQVQVNYEQMNDVSSRFAKQSDTVQSLLQMLLGKLDPLKGGSFMGQAADAFYAEMDDVLLPSVRKLQELLSEANVVTKEVSQIFQKADSEAESQCKGYN